MKRRLVFPLLLTAFSVLAAAMIVEAAEYHVSPTGDDANTGGPTDPLRTIQHAADMAQPGDVITVHEGVYRERISPPRGGESDAKRIVYQAAEGEKVEIKGSEVVKNWEKVQNDVWKVTLPNSFFGNFNPYADLIHGDWFSPRGRQHHTGAVYLNGEWLIEATKLDEVLMPPGASPTWLTEARGQYLLNVAWLRPGEQDEKSRRIPATSFIAKHNTQNAACSEGGECVGWISNGDWLRYDKVDFGERTAQLEIRVASATEGGLIEIRLDAPDGELLGSCLVTNTGDWQSWASVAAKIKPTSGARTLCLVFKRLKDSSLSGSLWFAEVNKEKTTIWAQFPAVNPNEQLVEINVRRTVFYPEKTGVNYLTVRGFTMRQAATPWAPPTAEQIGLIGAHWSKGWIIENNVISHSTCSGIALGKYGDQWDNTSADTAEGYVETIHRALKNGWIRDMVGHHRVWNNTISHCEQTGVVGSLGAAFSVVSGNNIHDIHVRRLFTGAEMAGIKFHGAIDVEISNNNIHRTCLGLWLDWMAQGARISCNVFHDNDADLFMEVDHGPYLVDNNLFLSPTAFINNSQGGAYVHNLIAGRLELIREDARLTPFHKPHSTELAGMSDNACGDDRYYNNLFIRQGDLSPYDAAKWQVWMDGNVFLGGAKPSKHEKDPVVKRHSKPAVKLIETDGEVRIEIPLERGWAGDRTRQRINTGMLGKARISGGAYENPDGSPLTIEADQPGVKRSANPAPGPFEKPDLSPIPLRVR
jgi:alpha-L-arabinofuranosidase